jgi:hypothetical protein
VAFSAGGDGEADRLSKAGLARHATGRRSTFLAACERWPDTFITLRQGARVIEDSRRLRVV